MSAGIQRKIIQKVITGTANFKRCAAKILPVLACFCKNANGGRQNAEKLIITPQFFGGIGGRTVRNNAPAPHEDNAINHGKKVFKSVFGDDDGCSEFGINALKRVEKLARRNRVKLRSRFIQKQKLRLHNRDRSKTEQLLLSAGQSGNRAVEPISDAEKTCHLRNAHTHFSVIRAETFKSESQFVPNFIRHDLHLRILHNKSDLFGLFAKRQFFNGFSVKINCTALFAVLTQCRFTLPQKRALAAAGCTAYKNKLAGLYFKINVAECGLRRFWVCKIQIFDFE